MTAFRLNNSLLNKAMVNMVYKTMYLHLFICVHFCSLFSFKLNKITRPGLNDLRLHVNLGPSGQDGETRCNDIGTKDILVAVILKVITW